VEGVGRKFGSVPLPRHQAAKLVRHLVRVQTTGIEERLSLDALHDGAGGGREGAASVGIEARLDHTIALDLHRDAHQIAARGATGGAGVRVVSQRALSARRIQVIGERPH
jgi:hypothetical protein